MQTCLRLGLTVSDEILYYNTLHTDQLLFYLRITDELAKKWNNAKMQNWAKVLNQLSCLDETCDRIARYIR